MPPARGEYDEWHDSLIANRWNTCNDDQQAITMANVENELNWAALLDAVRTAQKCCEQWMERGKLTRAHGEEIVANLQAQYGIYSQDASNNAAMPKVPGFLPGQTGETAGVRGYRAAMYVNELLLDLRSRGRISLSQFHALKADSDERLNAVRRQLQKEGIAERSLTIQCTPSAQGRARPFKTPETAAVASEPIPKPPAVPRRSLLEIILDPRSIQCLLGLGGALMVVGLVILLWINNYFTPPVMAGILAFSNILLLAVGLATIHYTRYQLAGKALALLSCLVMPLNLWYCHGNDLITIDGHLWMLAVLISALYAVSAVILKDELFVYVFSAGVAMTGLLFLADLQPSPQRFWEIASPATMLVVLGLIGIHLERAFVIGEGSSSAGQRQSLHSFIAGVRTSAWIAASADGCCRLSGSLRTAGRVGRRSAEMGICRSNAADRCDMSSGRASVSKCVAESDDMVLLCHRCGHDGCGCGDTVGVGSESLAESCSDHDADSDCVSCGRKVVRRPITSETTAVGCACVGWCDACFFFGIGL